MACCDGDIKGGAETVAMCGTEGVDTSTILSAKSVSAPMPNVSAVDARIDCTVVGSRCKNNCYRIFSSNVLSPSN